MVASGIAVAAGFGGLVGAGMSVGFGADVAVGGGTFVGVAVRASVPTPYRYTRCGLSTALSVITTCAV